MGPTKMGDEMNQADFSAANKCPLCFVHGGAHDLDTHRRQAVKPGDIVQITDPAHAWFRCFLLVTEVTSWGITADCVVPQTNTPGPGSTAVAPIRLLLGRYAKVGEALLGVER